MRPTYDTMYHMTHARKRIRKLSTAVFRGARTEYSFDVFPISPSITDWSAVFIFSRRLVDKKGRAHHAVSCVGEAKSLVAEIKRHKRSKCVKASAANVVCVLKEADRGSRVDVVQDISDARQFSCVRGEYKPLPKLQTIVKKPKSAKVIAFRPAKASIAAVEPTASHPKATQPMPKKGGKKQKLAPVNTPKAGRPSSRTSSRPKHDVNVDIAGTDQTTRPLKTFARRSRAKIASDTKARLKRAA